MLLPLSRCSNYINKRNTHKSHHQLGPKAGQNFPDSGTTVPAQRSAWSGSPLPDAVVNNLEVIKEIKNY